MTETTSPTSPTSPAWPDADVRPFHQRTLATADGLLPYVDEGEGPVLLLVHAGMWSFVWRDLIIALRDRYRCITVDPPGSGLARHLGEGPATMAQVRDTVATLFDALDLQDVTMVLHDLGGIASFAAVADRTDRIAGVVAANTFGWGPGRVLSAMLRLFGARWMGWLHAVTGWLTWASTSKFGVDRRMDRASRRAFRAGMDRTGRRAMHQRFGAAVADRDLHDAADRARRALSDRPALLVFGALGDYLRFRPRWRRELAGPTEVTVPWGLHFPMCDDPDLVARTIDGWHRTAVRDAG